MAGGGGADQRRTEQSTKGNLLHSLLTVPPCKFKRGLHILRHSGLDGPQGIREHALLRGEPYVEVAELA